MTPLQSFIALGLTIVLIAGWGIRCYRTPLNPLTVFAIVEMGIGQLFSGLVVYYVVRQYYPIEQTKYPDSFITMTALLAILYALGCTVPYFFRQRILVTYWGRFLRLLGLDYERTGATFVPWKFAVLVVAFFVCFGILAVVGGAGADWILHPRTAYGESRPGAHPFYAGSQWILMLAFIYYLWARRPRAWRLVWATAVYSLLVSFLASKGYIMAGAFVAAVYYHFRIKPIPAWVQIAAVPVGIAVSLVLMLAQGTSQDFLGTIVYYQDYFDSTAWFLSRFHEFGFRYGGVALSYLWFFVPRGLYPAKPVYWAYLYVNQMLYPGLIDQGVTPANLPWTTFYMDFGAIGVFIGGILTSLPRQVVYEHYLRNRTKIFPFIFAVHIGMLTIFDLAPLPILMGIVLLQSILLRVAIRGPGNRPDALAPVATT